MTWFHRMRALEVLFQFRFARVGQSLVDGIVVIPGPFTAFRRGPALAVRRLSRRHERRGLRPDHA